MPEKVCKQWAENPSDAHYREQVLREALGPDAYNAMFPLKVDTPDGNLNEHINLGDT